MNPWFTHNNFTSLEIRKYKSLADHTLVKVVRTVDLLYIHQLAHCIAVIPADGKMMISFSGNAEHIELLFHSKEGVQAIEIIQGGFKTPSTGFNGGNELERGIYTKICAEIEKGL